MTRKIALACSTSEMHEAQMASLAEQKEEALRSIHDLQLQLSKVNVYAVCM
jgi:hypothetical protein